MTILSATSEDVALGSEDCAALATKKLASSGKHAVPETKAKRPLPPLDIFVVETGNKYALGGLSLYYRDLQELVSSFDGPDPEMFDMSEYMAARGGVYFVVILPLEYATSREPESLPEYAPPGAVTQDEHGVVVGMGAIKSLGDGYAEVKRMWVNSQYRRMGIASRLMQRLEDYAASRNAGQDQNLANSNVAAQDPLTREAHHTMRLDTASDLHGAIATYHALGYHEIPRYNANGYAGVFFEKSLLPRQNAT